MNMTSEVHENLFSAVCSGDVEKVKIILSSGINVNFPVKEWCGESTCLHYAPSSEIVIELLLHGADVNAKDYNGRTPLQTAVSQRKDLAVVKELLKNGADPNARNFQGTTALTFAITNKNLKVIQELLNYGADINIRTTSPLLRFPTPLALAVSSNEDCGKLLIKITLIKNFNCDYRKGINLDLYTECINHIKLTTYLNDCICEIVKMKASKVNDNLTLYEFVSSKTENIKYLYEQYKVIDDQLSMDFPIYHDMIIDKINLFLKRAYLLDKLRGIYITENEVTLNPDCLVKIAEYLSNDDLCRFIETFHKTVDLHFYS